MRTRDIAIALAAGSGALLAIFLTPGTGRRPATPEPGAAAVRAPLPDPAAATPPTEPPAPSAPEAPCADPGPTRADANDDVAVTTDRVRSRTGPWWHAESYFADGSDFSAVQRRLGRAADEASWLRLFHRFWGSRRLGPRSEGFHATIPVRDPRPLASALDAARASATDPLSRQRLIFHAAIALPPEVAFPKLRRLRDGDDSADAMDAVAALAFRGDAESIADFLNAAERPSGGWEPRLDPPDGAEACARDAMRAWRCIEALTGEAYFHRDSFGHEWEGVGSRAFPWEAAPVADIDAVAAALLPGWIRRYPGHPGSDDAAWRLANGALRAGDAAGALRWASRGAVLPDQDMVRPCIELLVSIAELLPFEAVAPAFEPDPDAPGINRGLLDYLRIRRTAADRGFAAALAEVDRLASTERDHPLSRAYRSRWAEPPPRGLDDGVAPLPSTDPLRIVEGTRIPESPAVNPAFAWHSSDLRGEDGAPLEGDALREARVRPRGEAVILPARRLALQLRCWETLAELERRAAAASTLEDRADLLHKAASVLRREEDSLWPLYARDSTYRGCRPDIDRLDGWPASAMDEEIWLFRNLPLLRAGEAFAAVRDGFPGAAVAGRSAFAAGVTRIRASEKRAMQAGYRWGHPYPRAAARDALREGVSDLERCASGWPTSPVADDAAAAAAYRRRREKAETEKADTE